MKLVLITPITLEAGGPALTAALDDLGNSIYEPSLGVLTLAAVLRNAHVNATVFDLNGFVRDLYLGNPHDMVDVCPVAAKEIAALDAQILGFGTICNSYPVTVRIARELKRLRPDVKIIFGGPQASVVDVETLETFSFIDAIIRGEADDIIIPALTQIMAGRSIDVPGVTYRHRGEIIRNNNAKPVLDLDNIPFPAFELSRSIERCRYLPVEAGRGCPFSCTFCSTNDFFRRRFRLRSPARVLEEMDRLNATYGITNFDLVHDMFTVDRSRVEEFCHAFLEHGKQYSWKCSARSDFVDQGLLELMASAGCTGLFFGIETGSSRMQKIIDKALDIDQAAANLRFAGQNRINCTAAFIVGFPEETIEDVEATATFALDAARSDFVRVQIGLLAPLPATPLFTQYRKHLLFDGVYSDMSYQAWEQDLSDRALIKQYPNIFSNFYGLPSKADRQYVAKLRHFLMYGLNRARWLMIAFANAYPSVTGVFDQWSAWRRIDSYPSSYYGSFQFALDLCRFVREVLLPKFPANVVFMMLTYYDALHQFATDALCSESQREGKSPIIGLPLRLSYIRTIVLPFSPLAVIEALRHKTDLSRDCFVNTTVVVNLKDRGRVTASELPAIGAGVLERCDGQTSIFQMARDLECSLEGITKEEIVLQGLMLLCEQGFIQFDQAMACSL